MFSRQSGSKSSTLKFNNNGRHCLLSVCTAVCSYTWCTLMNQYKVQYGNKYMLDDSGSFYSNNNPLYTSKNLWQPKQIKQIIYTGTPACILKSPVCTSYKWRQLYIQALSAQMNMYASVVISPLLVRNFNAKWIRGPECIHWVFFTVYIHRRSWSCSKLS